MITRLRDHPAVPEVIHPAVADVPENEFPFAQRSRRNGRQTSSEFPHCCIRALEKLRHADFQNPSGALRSIRYVIYRRLRSRSASAVTSQSIGGGVDPAPAVNAVLVVIRASGTGVVGAVRTELHSDPA